jgi:hypothetical protein
MPAISICSPLPSQCLIVPTATQQGTQPAANGATRLGSRHQFWHNNIENIASTDICPLPKSARIKIILSQGTDQSPSTPSNCYLITQTVCRQNDKSRHALHKIISQRKEHTTCESTFPTKIQEHPLKSKLASSELYGSRRKKTSMHLIGNTGLQQQIFLSASYLLAQKIVQWSTPSAVSFCPLTHAV